VRRPVRIDDFTLLGDFHIAAARQCQSGTATVVRQIAPLLCTDSTGRVRRTDAGLGSAMVRQRQDRRAQPGSGRSVAECGLRMAGRSAVTVGNGGQLALRIAHGVTPHKAKVLLAGQTIFPRDDDEQLMSDSKVGGGPIPDGKYVRVEFKVRGWLGKTNNLGGEQLEKDLYLLQDDRADLLVIGLSETDDLKWRGDGPTYQAARRTGTARFAEVLVDPVAVTSWPARRDFTFEDQPWAMLTDKVLAAAGSSMPGAIHYVTLLWRRDVKVTPDIAPAP
jgi:hypothetical protein